MWMLPTNKSLLYALGIGLTLASVYGAGYTHARRIYRGEIAQMQQRHTEQALAAEQAYSAKLAEVSAEKQKWHDFAQQQSVKLAETSRQLDTQTTRPWLHRLRWWSARCCRPPLPNCWPSIRARRRRFQAAPPICSITPPTTAHGAEKETPKCAGGRNGIGASSNGYFRQSHPAGGAGARGGITPNQAT